ncbi:phage tail tape measure protein, partial [Methylobacterium gnaphalii]
MGNLTSTLSIRLNDDVSGPAARAAGALHKLGASGNDLKKLGAASPETARLIAQLEKLRAEAEKIGKIRTALDGVKASGAAYREARQDVTRLTGELAKARTTAEALKGVKGKAEERGKAEEEVRRLDRALRRATSNVDTTKDAFRASGQALRTARAEMTSAGVSAKSLSAAETAIGAAAAKTNAELAKQIGLLDRVSSHATSLAKANRDMTRAMGESARAQNRQIEAQTRQRDASRRLVDGMSLPARAARAEARVARAEAASARAELLEARRQARKETLGLIAGAAGVKAAHGVGHGAHASLETYREFDRERRFGKAVMGLTDEEQEPLIKQAIHMGASTKYNDVQVLESQRELAARGLNKDQVMGLMEPAANLGQSLDLSLPAAVKQMEGALFGFKKDISTTEAAKYSARQTADLQVKAAKVSGMTPEDLTQAYKYAATPARMAGVSEEMMLAFAGISKKANMGGDESGVAFRALIANAVSPTRKGKEAMLANGLDYKNYQRNPDSLKLDPFVKNIAAQYGVELNKSSREGLGKIFADKDVISDPSKFAPAVTKLLSDTLGGDDAKSKKSIAGAANRYRDASMQSVDVNALMADLMKKLPGNLQLANALFGSKQGSRIATALGDPATVNHIVDELKNHSEGFSEKISAERMAGFDGAVSRFEGAVKNLETSIGRAWDSNGSGGPLTALTNMAGKATQALAELSPNATMAASGLAAIGGLAAGLYGTWKIAKTVLGFGSGVALTASATALDASAAALTAAAAKLAGGSVVDNASKAASAAPGAASAAPALA